MRSFHSDKFRTKHKKCSKKYEFKKHACGEFDPRNIVGICLGPGGVAKRFYTPDSVTPPLLFKNPALRVWCFLGVVLNKFASYKSV